MRLFASLGAILAVALLLSSCGETAQVRSADLIIDNARIYTVNRDAPWAEAVAVADGEIIAVGTSELVSRHRVDGTEVRDVGGAFVMPGIIDAHAHPAWGGVIALYYCYFSAAAPPDEVIRTIEQCVSETDEQTVWIQGGLWTPKFFEQFGISSPRDWLDRISGGKAIALKDDSGHNYWVNSRGLELLGIDESSEPPPGGVYGRTPEGDRLNGLLMETFAMLNEALPPWSVDHYKAGIHHAVADANRFGITGWKDASASDTELAAYQQVDSEGDLNVHVAACLYDSEGSDVAGYEAMRDRFASGHVHTNFVKLFMDGVPTTARTAAMLAPYQPTYEGEPEVFGPLHMPAETLAEKLTALDAAGFTVKVHTAGDRSVHVGLNAIAAARTANGDSGLRHELAHAGFIDGEDIPRFSELNAVADLSPYLWFPSPIIDDIHTALGDRGSEYWPNRQLLDAGAPVLAGSDWPSVAEDLNPWVGIESLVTRAHPADLHPGKAWGEEALTMAEVLRIFTLEGARALGLEDRIGSIEVGKSADLIVLDRDPLGVPASEVGETQVSLTLFEGHVVYGG